MSVLIEAINIITKRSVLESKFPGGLAGYSAAVSNRTFCADEHLTRVGFMTAADAQRFVSFLVQMGLAPFDSQAFVDYAVVDQHQGPTAPTPWLQTGRRADGVNFAFLAGQAPGDVAVPQGWSFEASLTRTGVYVPPGQEPEKVAQGTGEGAVERRVTRVPVPAAAGSGVTAYAQDSREDPAGFFAEVIRAERERLERARKTRDDVNAKAGPVDSRTARDALRAYMQTHPQFGTVDLLRRALASRQLVALDLPREVRWGLHYAGVLDQREV